MDHLCHRRSFRPEAPDLDQLCRTDGRKPALDDAFNTAILTCSFHPESFSSLRQMLRAIAGGVLMGFGGVLPLGCSIGQGLSGVSTLSLGSIVALAGIAAGALVALSPFPQPTSAGATT
ncbi:YeeE/YedE thiosulfate transporter family protein [Paracoccus chinensis]|uniref:YeeE/YedE thiosulfate transporter family protein n=1 Tax=Paracoccus chinensis TaxID=525640 RepID=UPI001C31A78F